MERDFQIWFPGRKEGLQSFAYKLHEHKENQAGGQWVVTTGWGVRFCNK